MKWLKKILENYPSEILSDEEKALIELAFIDFIELMMLSIVFTIVGCIIIFLFLILGTVI